MSAGRGVLLYVLLVGLASSTARAGEGRVREKQTLAELLGNQDAGPPSPVADPSSLALPGPWKLGATGASLAMLVVVLAVILRQRARNRGPRDSGVVQVLGRAQLSPRHAVVVLSVAHRRLVVGIAGDRLTALGDLPEPESVADSPEETDLEPASPPAPPPLLSSAPRGFTVRAEDRQQLLEAQALEDSELRPYRKQMDRLRGLLRDMRGESAEEAG